MWAELIEDAIKAQQDAKLGEQALLVRNERGETPLLSGLRSGITANETARLIDRQRRVLMIADDDNVLPLQLAATTLNADIINVLLADENSAFRTLCVPFYSPQSMVERGRQTSVHAILVRIDKGELPAMSERLAKLIVDAGCYTSRIKNPTLDHAVYVYRRDMYQLYSRFEDILFNATWLSRHAHAFVKDNTQLTANMMRFWRCYVAAITNTPPTDEAYMHLTYAQLCAKLNTVLETYEGAIQL